MTYPTKKEVDIAGLSVFQTILSDNVCRIGKFATRTSLAEINGKKVVYKTAITKDARPFLKQVIEREKENLGYLEGQFEVLCGTLEDGRIEYEYLPYPSLQDLIATHLRKGDWRNANELVTEYKNRVLALEKVKTTPKEFLEDIAFGSDGNLNVCCLSRGLLDLIPSNILVSSDKWIVIDNEWSFDFPVPVAFVLFRAIRTLAISLQRDIRKATCRGNPALGMFKLGFSTYYVPSSWAKSIGDDYMKIFQMNQWEMGFQWYVLGVKSSLSSRVEVTPKQRTHFSKVSILMSMLKKRARYLPVIRQLLYLLHRIAF